MVIDPSEEQPSSARDPQARLHRVPGVHIDEGFPEPTAGMVLHRVLAGAARTFLLNDMGSELADDATGCEMVGPVDALMLPRPVWAQSAAIELAGIQRGDTETERIHQSRVAMRRIRSNVRTFRLLVDPAWGTSLRAELAWYGDRLGQARDLHIIRDVITVKGPTVIEPGQVARLDEVVSARLAAALADIAAERGGARRFQLTEQMMVLWDGPAFKSKAQQPARKVMPVMLHRAWHDLRGAARTARKKPTDENLHRLRIRLKDLRYGCNTVTLVEGGPARKTAKAAERLQTKLGDLHDACYSIEWLHALADERSDLADPIDHLVSLQRDAAAQARKGWKRELKEIERRWRSWNT
jgi:CHAD domain-containing protein